MEMIRPDIQLIARIVVSDPAAGKVLLVRPDPEDERWWLPSGDLEPFQHPDARARELLDAVPGLAWDGLRMTGVESFRGRRGWHVLFDYHATGSSSGGETGTAAWFAPDAMPRTMFGRHERDTVEKVLGTDRV